MVKLTRKRKKGDDLGAGSQNTAFKEQIKNLKEQGKIKIEGEKLMFFPVGLMSTASKKKGKHSSQFIPEAENQSLITSSKGKAGQI